MNYRGHVIVAHACQWIQGSTQTEYAVRHILVHTHVQFVANWTYFDWGLFAIDLHTVTKTMTLCLPAESQGWISPLFLSYSLYPSCFVLFMAIKPWNVQKQAAVLLNFSLETLGMTALAVWCLHIDMSQDYISVKKGTRGHVKDVSLSVKISGCKIFWFRSYKTHVLRRWRKSKVGIEGGCRKLGGGRDGCRMWL